MTYYLAKSPVGPHYAFTSRDYAERFKVSRLDDKHMEVVEVVSADEAKRLEAEVAAMGEVLDKVGFYCAGEEKFDGVSKLCLKALSDTTAGRSLLERLERYEKALKRIGLDCATSADLIAREALKGNQ